MREIGVHDDNKVTSGELDAVYIGRAYRVKIVMT